MHFSLSYRRCDSAQNKQLLMPLFLTSNSIAITSVPFSAAAFLSQITPPPLFFLIPPLCIYITLFLFWSKSSIFLSLVSIHFPYSNYLCYFSLPSVCQYSSHSLKVPHANLLEFNLIRKFLYPLISHRAVLIQMEALIFHAHGVLRVSRYLQGSSGVHAQFRLNCSCHVFSVPLFSPSCKGRVIHFDFNDANPFKKSAIVKRYELLRPIVFQRE